MLVQIAFESKVIIWVIEKFNVPTSWSQCGFVKFSFSMQSCFTRLKEHKSKSTSFALDLGYFNILFLDFLKIIKKSLYFLRWDSPRQSF